jgi:hypothetical protein
MKDEEMYIFIEYLLSLTGTGCRTTTEKWLNFGLIVRFSSIIGLFSNFINGWPWDHIIPDVCSVKSRFHC